MWLSGLAPACTLCPQWAVSGRAAARRLPVPRLRRVRPLRRSGAMAEREMRPGRAAYVEAVGVDEDSRIAVGCAEAHEHLVALSYGDLAEMQVVPCYPRGELYGNVVAKELLDGCRQLIRAAAQELGGAWVAVEGGGVAGCSRGSHQPTGRRSPRRTGSGRRTRAARPSRSR